ncbi:hypothetical protein [Flavobacterium haoranii]|uniref:Uncharacterized protein n=1 Tax=Flavobacterium haoranii TaxID=683124 RepID=A0A1M6CQ18_9FLAO|nr:hypothetical protein [Flavobacterium haoranii]SHI62941.1 hypothetical protein SAMN05444337_0433 [Flavobacterium haoranii]
MKFKTLALLITLLISSLTYSQFEDDPGFGGGSGDPASEPLQTPIDNIIIPLLITGILTSIYFIKKKEKQLH